MCDSVSVLDDLWWDDTEAEHILNRSNRYSGATNIDLGWTLEVAADPYRVVRAPDLKS